MRVLVCGDRNWTLDNYLYMKLDALHYETPITCVINGLARGADIMGRFWAFGKNISTADYPALWDKYGRAAGPIRNKQMLDEGNPDLVVAFHGDIDNSKGTKNMINQTRTRKIPFRIYTGV